MALSFEQVKRLMREVLAHDRWNSGLSDERLAEKLATSIAKGGSATDAARAAGSQDSIPAQH